MKLAARRSPCVRYAPLARTEPEQERFELSCRAFQNRGVARAEPVGWIAGSSAAMTRERAPSRFRSRRSATESEANAHATSASRIRKCASAGADGTSVSPGALSSMLPHPSGPGLPGLRDGGHVETARGRTRACWPGPDKIDGGRARRVLLSA